MARIFEMPVVLTSSQEDRIQGPLIPELQQIFPETFAARVKRDGIVNAWTHQGFRNAVEQAERRNLIMAGVTTDVCLVFPAIDACGAGFSVQAVMDASGSPFVVSEELSQRRMAEAGVTLTASNTLIAEMAPDWSTPEGQELMQILFADILPPIQPSGSIG